MRSEGLDHSTLTQIKELVRCNIGARDELYAGAEALSEDALVMILRRLADELGGNAADLQQILVSAGDPGDTTPSEPLMRDLQTNIIQLLEKRHGQTAVLSEAEDVERRLRKQFDAAIQAVTNANVEGVLRRHRGSVLFAETVLNCIRRPITESLPESSIVSTTLPLAGTAPDPTPIDMKELGKVDCFGATDIGKKRKFNEDQFLIADLSKSMRVHRTSLGLHQKTRLFGNSQGMLLAVADGMGGHQAGERASQLAVDSVVTYVLNSLPWNELAEGNDGGFRDELRDALLHCESMLRKDMAMAPRREGMGTTMTMVYVSWPRAYVVHVGDSRCYLLRDKQLRQVTRDHTIEQLLRVAMTKDEKHELEGVTSNWNNMLWNVIGGADDDTLQPEIYELELQHGDALVLCTDGLTKQINDARLRDVLATNDTAESLCKRLITEANQRGGSDNVTVVVSRFDDLGQVSVHETPETETAAVELPETDLYVPPKPMAASVS